MLLETKSDVLSSNIGESSDFTIKASAHAFQILSDGLYSDSISAVIREISCNAYDAHLAAKQSLPFIVTLPTTLNPVFSVEDFGTGLAEYDVAHLFTSYFSSTKSDSNEFTGAFGLGCKSPFSYTDNFTIRSRFNGTETEYLCHLDGGMPKLTKLNQCATEKHNGIKITISVKAVDMREFISKAPSQLSYFPKGAVEVRGEFAPIQYKDMGDYLDLGKKQYWESNVVFAKQGAVVYELDRRYLTDLFNTFFNTRKTVLCFEMGDLAVTPSREQLKYTENTIANIARKCKEITDTYYENLWNQEYKGKPLTYALVQQLARVAIKGSGEYVDKLKKVRDHEFTVDQEANYLTRYNSSTGGLTKKVTRRGVSEIKLTGSTKITHVFFNNVEKGYVSRVQQYMVDNGIKCAYQVQGEYDKDLIEKLGDIDWVVVSNMPEVTRTASSSGVAKSARKVVTNLSTWGRYHDEYDVTDEDIKNGFYYLWIIRNSMVDNKTDTYNPDSLSTSHIAVKEFNGKPVYYLGPRNKSLAKKGINLLDHLSKQKIPVDRLVGRGAYSKLINLLDKKAALLSSEEALIFKNTSVNIDDVNKKEREIIDKTDPITLFKHLNEISYYATDELSQLKDEIQNKIIDAATAYFNTQGE